MEDCFPLEVRLFGNGKVSYGEKELLSEKSSIPRSMKLLLILLYHGKEGISRDRLMSDLYGDEALADLSNNFRVTMHRVKKMLAEAGLPEYEYISVKDGVYYWDCPMEIRVDVHTFKELIARAGEEQNPDRKLQLLKDVCKLYTGEFLQKLSGDGWVIVESLTCKFLYFDALRDLCELLMERREYEEILTLVEPACEMYPFDEWQSLQMECYLAMHRHREAMLLYEATAKMLYEELGIQPPEKMREQFKALSEYTKNRPKLIGEIKELLMEDAGHAGAFFCHFPGFRDAYRVLRRGIDRHGYTVSLVVFTLTEREEGVCPDDEILEEMSGKLKDAIHVNLRVSDSFTQYNRSQYLVMLVGTDEANCEHAIARIRNYFADGHEAWLAYLEHSVALLSPDSVSEKRRKK